MIYSIILSIALFIAPRMRLVKFFTVGAIGMPVNLGILYGLTESGLFYIASAAIAVYVAISFNYFLNHYWTFKDRQTSGLFRGYLKYMVVGAVSEGMYLGLLALAVEVLHIYYVLAAGAIVIGLGFLRFYVIGRWIWRKNEGKPKASRWSKSKVKEEVALKAVETALR